MYNIDNTKLSRYKAVNRGLFTEYEMQSILMSLESDLEEFFWAMDNLSGNELKRSLRQYKQEYQYRFNINSIEDQNGLRHSYNKLMIFIDEEIEKLYSSSDTPPNIVVSNAEPKELAPNGEDKLALNDEDKSDSSTDDKSATNNEALIALWYLVYKANGDKKLSRDNVTALLYFLRKKKPKSLFENTTEFGQLKELFRDMESPNFSFYGEKAATFLRDIGLGRVALKIENDIKAPKTKTLGTTKGKKKS